MRLRDMVAIGWSCALVSACTVIVEERLQGKEDEPPDAPTGAACTTTEQCLMIEASLFDCTLECVDGRCRATERGTPNGTACGRPASGEHCVSRRCVARECGDGFVGSLADPPEYCDDGNRLDTDSCNNACTSLCEAPATPGRCPDDDTCQVEFCETSTAPDLCRPRDDPMADGTECMAGALPGRCYRGRCVPD